MHIGWVLKFNNFYFFSCIWRQLSDKLLGWSVLIRMGYDFFYYYHFIIIRYYLFIYFFICMNLRQLSGGC